MLGLKAQVLSSRYIDDRYELVTEVEGHRLKLFAERALSPGESVQLRVDAGALRHLADSAPSSRQ